MVLFCRCAVILSASHANIGWFLNIWLLQVLLRVSKIAREASKHFGKGPGVRHSHTARYGFCLV
ncbi:hypothetical protein HanXRQr2_Chr02g0059801 [Helianthus annuus]|uniref:Uncharacterized protein n=1 Tax=Helianthus annuus TaxID=4232 RepID=A0A9K3JMM7_HELAN|nr:hypothetical protein HanXRQr2_Chr02g0059801 [Helianthus annuus]KAJ0951345.1 hypothetical protein HanPSC8_Chr02g0058881 [Helianthus annuus]